MNRTAWQIAIFSAASALGGTYLFGGEWLRYFSYFGTWGSFGIVLVSVAISLLTARLLLLMNQTGIRSHAQLISWLFGEKAAPSLSFLLTFVLLLQVGTTLNQQSSALSASLGIPAAVSVLLLVMAAFTLLRLQGAALLKSAVAGLAAGIIIIVSLFFVQHHVPMPPLTYQLGTAWLWHALFYVCLHVLFLIAVFLPNQQGYEHSLDRRSIHYGAIIGGLLFLVITLVGHFAILAHWHDAHSVNQPLFVILKSFSPLLVVPFLLGSLVQACFLCSVLIRSVSAPLIHRYDLRPVPVQLLFLLLSAMMALGMSLLDGFTLIADVPARLVGFALLFRLVQRTLQRSP